MKTTVKLSKASKMPCKSWSLQALDTCPASKNADGTLVPACEGCYATTGNYRFPNVKAPREFNREDWQRDEWAEEMVYELRKQSYFRWFDSGDVYDIRLARKILAVMEDTPDTQHWLPTRMHKFPKFKEVLEAMDELENVVVRYSSDGIHGEIVKANCSSTIIGDDSLATDVMTVCRAYENEGKCGECRTCWSKQVPVVAYIAHGRKMEGLIARSS